MSVSSTDDLPALNAILFDRPAGRNIIGHAIDTIKALRAERDALREDVEQHFIRNRELRDELDIAKHGIPGPIAEQGLRYLSMKARAEQAEAERDRANALLAEAVPFIGWCGPSGDLKERIDAHLQGKPSAREGEGR